MLKGKKVEGKLNDSSDYTFNEIIQLAETSQSNCSQRAAIQLSVCFTLEN